MPLRLQTWPSNHRRIPSNSRTKRLRGHRKTTRPKQRSRRPARVAEDGRTRHPGPAAAALLSLTVLRRLLSSRSAVHRRVPCLSRSQVLVGIHDESWSVWRLSGELVPLDRIFSWFLCLSADMSFTQLPALPSVALAARLLHPVFMAIFLFRLFPHGTRRFCRYSRNQTRLCHPPAARPTRVDCLRWMSRGLLALTSSST